MDDKKIKRAAATANVPVPVVKHIVSRIDNVLSGDVITAAEEEVIRKKAREVSSKIGGGQKTEDELLE